MADTEAEPVPVAETPKAAPKKGKAAKAKKSPGKKAKKPTSNHPKVAEMVTEALLNLHDRKGTSLKAVKNYIEENFKVDMDKLTIFIRRYIKKAVADGTLVQTKGTGASGSFKLADKDLPKTAKKPAEERKPVAAPKKAAKKVAKPIKKASPKKVETPKKLKSAKKSKSPKKEKKAKSPKKPKSPKPKKAAAKKSAKK